MPLRNRTPRHDQIPQAPPPASPPPGNLEAADYEADVTAPNEDHSHPSTDHAGNRHSINGRTTSGHGSDVELQNSWSPMSLKRSRPRSQKDTLLSREESRIKRRGGILRSWTFWLLVLIILTAVIIYLLLASPHWHPLEPKDGLSPPFYPAPPGGTTQGWQSSYTKAASLVSSMTLAHKVNITTGTGWSMGPCVGNTGQTSVGFPALCLQDGPTGIRFVDNATYWPPGITAAATWNKDLIRLRGQGLGKEHRLKGVNVLLGPCLGPLGRSPLGGRNWEGFGPDPYLTGVASAQTIRGIQSEGVIATAKHYIANEQEHFRQPGPEWGIKYAMSSNVDDRTLHELYSWPFQDSIRAGVGSVMCSYNMVNDSHTCQNSKLMNGIIKDELGFQGFVQSDWLAQRSGVASALAGLDMSMPGDGPEWADSNPFWGRNLTEAVLNRSVPMDRINDMATRIVATWYQMGQDNETNYPKVEAGEESRPTFSSFTTDRIGSPHPGSNDTSRVVVNQFKNVQGKGNQSHALLARKIAAEGTVLLKNEGGILPISPDRWSSKQYKVGIFGEDADRAANKSRPWPNQCEDRACNEGTLATGWGSGAAVFPFLTTPIEALQQAFNDSNLVLQTSLTNDPKPSVDLSRLDLCLVFANSDSGEGFHTWDGVTDRKHLFLQKGGDDLVQGIASACNNTVVIIHAVGPVSVDRWIQQSNIKALVFANLPGETSGDSLVDVLFGKVDASGRLPFTIGKRLEDYGPGGQIMYEPNHKLAPQQIFKEGLYIDYRHFDNEQIEPTYPFGYGLSYTSWQLSALKVETLKPRSSHPDPRPASFISPPTFPHTVPDQSEVTWPSGMQRLGKFIYPYLEPGQKITEGEYPYPTGYNHAQTPSPAGGGEGGNPSLWEEHVRITVNVSNTGTRPGQQVIQLYVSFPENVHDDSTNAAIDFPVRVLRGFEKITVAEGESSSVSMNLTRRDLSYWSVGHQNWIMPDSGTFLFAVGLHSRDPQSLTVHWP